MGGGTRSERIDWRSSWVVLAGLLVLALVFGVASGLSRVAAAADAKARVVSVVCERNAPTPGDAPPRVHVRVVSPRAQSVRCVLELTQSGRTWHREQDVRLGAEEERDLAFTLAGWRPDGSEPSLKAWIE